MASRASAPVRSSGHYGCQPVGTIIDNGRLLETGALKVGVPQ